MAEIATRPSSRRTVSPVGNVAAVSQQEETMEIDPRQMAIQQAREDVRRLEADLAAAVEQENRGGRTKERRRKLRERVDDIRKALERARLRAEGRFSEAEELSFRQSIEEKRERRIQALERAIQETSENPNLTKSVAGIQVRRGKVVSRSSPPPASEPITTDLLKIVEDRSVMKGGVREGEESLKGKTVRATFFGDRTVFNVIEPKTSVRTGPAVGGMSSVTGQSMQVDPSGKPVLSQVLPPRPTIGGEEIVNSVLDTETNRRALSTSSGKLFIEETEEERKARETETQSSQLPLFREFIPATTLAQVEEFETERARKAFESASPASKELLLGYQSIPAITDSVFSGKFSPEDIKQSQEERAVQSIRFNLRGADETFIKKGEEAFSLTSELNRKFIENDPTTQKGRFEFISRPFLELVTSVIPVGLPLKLSSSVLPRSTGSAMAALTKQEGRLARVVGNTGTQEIVIETGRKSGKVVTGTTITDLVSTGTKNEGTVAMKTVLLETEKKSAVLPITRESKETLVGFVTSRKVGDSAVQTSQVLTGSSTTLAGSSVDTVLEVGGRRVIASSEGFSFPPNQSPKKVIMARRASMEEENPLLLEVFPGAKQPDLTGSTVLSPESVGKSREFGLLRGSTNERDFSAVVVSDVVSTGGSTPKSFAVRTILSEQELRPRGGAVRKETDSFVQVAMSRRVSLEGGPSVVESRGFFLSPRGMVPFEEMSTAIRSGKFEVSADEGFSFSSVSKAPEKLRPPETRSFASTEFAELGPRKTGEASVVTTLIKPRQPDRKFFPNIKLPSTRFKSEVRGMSASEDLSFVGGRKVQFSEFMSVSKTGQGGRKVSESVARGSTVTTFLDEGEAFSRVSSKSKVFDLLTRETRKERGAGNVRTKQIKSLFGRDVEEGKFFAFSGRNLSVGNLAVQGRLRGFAKRVSKEDFMKKFGPRRSGEVSGKEAGGSPTQVFQDVHGRSGQQSKQSTRPGIGATSLHVASKSRQAAQSSAEAEFLSGLGKSQGGVQSASEFATMSEKLQSVPKQSLKRVSRKRAVRLKSRTLPQRLAGLSATLAQSLGRSAAMAAGQIDRSVSIQKQAQRQKITQRQAGRFKFGRPQKQAFNFPHASEFPVMFGFGGGVPHAPSAFTPKKLSRPPVVPPIIPPMSITSDRGFKKMKGKSFRFRVIDKNIPGPLEVLTGRRGLKL